MYVKLMKMNWKMLDVIPQMSLCRLRCHDHKKNKLQLCDEMDRSGADVLAQMPDKIHWSFTWRKMDNISMITAGRPGVRESWKNKSRGTKMGLGVAVR